MLALERAHLIFVSSIGQFGWLTIPSSYGVIVAWVAAFGAVVLVGTCLARRRGAAVVMGTLAAWLLVPFVMILAEAHQQGILGQGRDFLGVVVGVPIVAAAVAGERFADRQATVRLARVVIAVLAVCQVADFYGTVRSFTVGMDGPLNAFATVWRVWHPPVPAAALVVAYTVATVAVALMLRSALPAASKGQRALFPTGPRCTEHV
jgi:hypothetical protein